MSWNDLNLTLLILIFFFGIYKPNFCHKALSSIILAILSTWLSNEEDNFFAKKLFGFSNFLIDIFSPNFSLKICSALPMPSISPNFSDADPDQNSPVKILFFSGSTSLSLLLFLTRLIKSEWSSSCNFLILSISSCFSSLKGSKVLLFFPAV